MGDRSGSMLVRSRWAAIGAAVTIAIGGAWIVHADGTASSLVPVAPCRLLDTRPTTQVGTRGTPLGANETFTQQVTGTNGNCTIPAGATAVAMNVTAVGGTAASFLTVFPADLAVAPTASNLNWQPGAAPTPNKVDVQLSPSGAIKLYNLNGTVDVLADVVGYYVAGAAGPAGPTGPTGPRGVSGWDTIPSGTTVTGTGVYDITTSVADVDDIIFVPLPAKAPVPLTAADVGSAPDAFGATFPVESTCTGSFTSPTAPAGKACVYFNVVSVAWTSVGVGLAIAASSTDGFTIEAATAANDTNAFFTYRWAYTAP